MKNEEIYKTLDARQKAFNCFCISQDCNKCPIWSHKKNLNAKDYAKGYCSCALIWLELEDEPAILPCPICGKEPVLVKADNHGESIGCPDCGLHLNCKSMTETVPELVARWNTRWDGTEEHKN